MPIVTRWDNDERTQLDVRFVMPWSGPDVLDYLNVTVQLLASVPHIVDILVDFREGNGHIPNNYLPAIVRMREISAIPHGVVIVYGASYLIQKLCNIAKGMAPEAFRNVYFVATYEEAQVLLAKARADRA